jgi:hypothetical protein
VQSVEHVALLLNCSQTSTSKNKSYKLATQTLNVKRI